MLMDSSATTTVLPLYHNLRTTEHPDDPYGPLVKCLAQEEEFAVLASLRLLGLLVAYVLSPLLIATASAFHTCTTYLEIHIQVT